MKNTVATFLAAKGKEKLSMVTAYDYLTAKMIDVSEINAILVGDSLGMVMLGYENTLAVTVEDMIHHCKAVSRGCTQALLVCDMPYLSYHVSMTETVRNAGRLIQEGFAEAVKLEGGREFCDEIRLLTRASIPVMGHLGLTPQSVHAFGGFKVQGKSVAAAQKLLDDARAIQDAGVFSVVLEGIPAALGKRITAELEVPTIGIGAGVHCDGQVLVWHDMLGMTARQPKFVKCYATLQPEIEEALKAYDRDVKNSVFPDLQYSYSVNNEEEMIAQLR